MQNFMKIVERLDVLPLLMQLQNQPHLWDENTLRTAVPGSPHAACSDIWLMFNEINTGDLEKVINDKEVIPYLAWVQLPAAKELALDLMRRVGGWRLGRVIITKLPPGQAITPHKDGGAPAEYFQRFQVALRSLPGCVFKIGDEQMQFNSGDIWWINNREEHGVQNNSADDRIVMIVDIRID